MEMRKLKGSEIPPTLEQMEAERERRHAAIRADYYAGKLGFMAAVHAREDVDRAIDRARWQRSCDILANLRRAA